MKNEEWCRQLASRVQACFEWRMMLNSRDERRYYSGEFIVLHRAIQCCSVRRYLVLTGR